ncbi:MAG: hypothetical protein IPP72_20950 [Chitinophagaceae bacterium]|nr:hypothetical protein [Chitinophagaceae bacterium]
MFTQTWKKYLSIIIILIKRSVNGPQEMQVNFSDFERAAGGRKIKFNFSNMQLNNGRQNYGEKLPPVATDLIQVLQENDAALQLLKNKNYEFAMTSNMMLTITNTTPVAEAEVPAADTDEVVEDVEAV